MLSFRIYSRNFPFFFSPLTQATTLFIQEMHFREPNIHKLPSAAVSMDLTSLQLGSGNLEFLRPPYLCSLLSQGASDFLGQDLAYRWKEIGNEVFRELYKSFWHGFE